MGDWSIDTSCVAPIEIAWFAKDWSGIEQVFRLQRTTTLLKTGEIRQQVIYGREPSSHASGSAAQALGTGTPSLAH